MKVLLPGGPRAFRAVGWGAGSVRMIAQRLLPERFEILTCRSAEEVAKAIEDMAVRGAPAIGVAAAYGVALASLGTSPTAALAVSCGAAGPRPGPRGARLTAWELGQEGIDHAILADAASGMLLARGDVDLVLVGADRITASGDFANKIGTYEKAVPAKEHGVPFYVAAPRSTFDFSLDQEAEIPIEERSEVEVTEVGGVRVANPGSRAFNPAFDVTPARYVTGYITEIGVIRPDQVRSLAPRDGP